PPFSEPLVFVDAIDRNRNAAAAVTKAALDEFILLARDFVKRPREALFFPKKKKHSKQQVLAAMRKRGTDFLLLEFKAPKIVDDILWPQLARTTRSLAKQLALNEWRVRGTTHFVNEENGKGFILFELESIERPRTTKIFGPPVEREEDVKRFLKAHAKALKKPRVENGRIVVEEKRGVTNATKFLRNALQEPVKIGVASRLRRSIRAARFSTNADAVRQETLAGIAKYLF
ncbi:MAG: hypothetical protein QW343_02965, partial [Candidatus Norongarragalinales archaeon]